MSSLSNLIERHLRQLLKESIKGYIEIRRNELAEQFRCVPSQINYVLSTRFTYENGFLVESQRGGAGFVRIVKLMLNREDTSSSILTYLTEMIGNSISQSAAEGIVNRLLEENTVTQREASLMKAAMHRNVLKVDLPWRDNVRALILKAMLVSLLRDNK
ncbi:transcriptional repressor, CtsR [Desulfofarcimen acetoxidans DSM 771]|jgi:transcriptional regulator CtsR|uniref:Transcriptional regulator CtsR n=1 Tax=Desulfofarcimen acetoxidans (strain ATCC 49208 / DSM 771 / KCTC 5769 / VKM B-1644 / 5575) TaxID=485916 RepID=C8W3V1_DESAS|nr:CtsR family transcriptional regulator [Desulfofarcimen acetoxidans]ACV61205.1 transcriptional repressor, CtsR [Desulfofarcimen acetoxidans DSM 771]